MIEISVIMGVYKEGQYGIRRAVDSILNQTFRDFEFIIIIDDPGNLRAIELISNYSSTDQRVKYLVNEINIGLFASLNKGIKMSVGKYIARQDTEDVSYPERLKTQYNYLQKNPDVDLVGTTWRYIDIQNRLSFFIKYKPVVGREIKRENPIPHPTVLIKRETFSKYGYYIEDGMDYDLWVDWYLKSVTLHNLQECYYDYYQTKSEKIAKIRPYLINDTHCKLKNAKELNLNFRDYVYLYIEKAFLLLPSFLIIEIVYFFYRLRPKAPAHRN